MPRAIMNASQSSIVRSVETALAGTLRRSVIASSAGDSSVRRAGGAGMATCAPAGSGRWDRAE